ncbi:MAG: protein kinase [Gammaproteobacteria bacterium]|nr:protein kinase [Gammaproteobacteria bacterium]
MRGDGFRDILPAGYTLHWYELEDVLGRGGYGITYLALDRNLHRKVAIKEYLPVDFACRESNDTVHPLTGNHQELYDWGLERFLVEARTLAKFNHTSIIRVLSVFEQNNTAYMVMEYEEGSDLSVVYKGKIASTEVELLPVFIPILEGLSLVHDEGFIHRDIKPSNIYVRCDGSAVLLDFGSARQTLGSRTRALTSLVTSGYAPFEQYNESEEEQGAWTDIYSLGSTLYFCITGDKPADALKRGSSLIKQGYDIYKPVSELAPPGFSRHFLMAIDHALMFHAEARPQTALQWADMLSGNVDIAALPVALFTAPNAVAASFGDEIANQGRALGEATPNQDNNIQSGLSAGDQELGSTQDSQPEQDDSTRVQLHKPPGPQAVVSLDDTAQRQSQDKTAASPQRNDKPWSWLVGNFVDILGVTFNALVTKNKKVLVAGLLGLPLLGVIITVFYSTDSVPVPPAENTKNVNGDNVQEQQWIPVEEHSPEELIAMAEQALIVDLLTQAELHVAERRYLEPAENNAIFQYNKILALDPDHAAAKEGVLQIVEHYANLVEDNIAAGQWQQAQLYFTGLKSIAVNAEVVEKLQTRFEQRRELMSKLKRHLALADRYMSESKLTQPTSKNAFALYREVLKLDPGNAQAQLGLEKIVQILSVILKKQLKAKQISRAEVTFEKIAKINADAPILGEVESQLSKIAAKRKKIANLLRSAERDFISGKLIKPKGNNALAKYRNVLKLSPKNRRARAGVGRVYDYYVSLFNQHLDRRELQKADKIIQTLLIIGYGKKATAKLSAKIKAEKLVIKNEPKIINDLLTELKTGLEKRDIKKIESISYFDKNEKKFINELFEKYAEFTVKVLKNSHNTELHQVNVRIEFENLVDHWDDKIEKSDWISVDVQVIKNKNKQKQWRVYW